METFYDSETVTMVRTCVNKSVAPVMKFFSGIRQPTQNVRQVIRIYLRSHCAIAYGRFSPGDDVLFSIRVRPKRGIARAWKW